MPHLTNIIPSSWGSPLRAKSIAPLRERFNSNISPDALQVFAPVLPPPRRLGAPPPDLLARCDPIQRQLLGDVKSVLGFYLPTDEDVPLRAWWRERQASPNGAG